MAYTRTSSTHNPTAGAVAPSNWGDGINDNFDALNDLFRIELFPADSGGAVTGLAVAPYSQPDSGTSDGTKPSWPALEVSGTVSIGRGWNRRMSRVYGGSAVLAGSYYCDSATSGDLVFGAVLSAVANGGTAVNNANYDTQNVGTVTVPGTTYTEQTFTVTLSNVDSIAASSRFSIAFFNDKADAGDTAAGTAFITGLDLFFNLSG